MARAVRFHQHGGPEVLRIETIDVAPPAKGEVQIRVRALGLNRAEALLRRGTYIETAKFPSGLGLEAALADQGDGGGEVALLVDARGLDHVGLVGEVANRVRELLRTRRQTRGPRRNTV